VCAEIRDVQVAGTVDGDIPGLVELRAVRRDGTGRERRLFPSARDRGEFTVRAQASYAGIAQVGDVQVSLAVEGDSIWGVELRLRSRTAVSPDSGDSCAGNRPYRSESVHFPDPVVAGI
jgi:hypothetical protein